MQVFTVGGFVRDTLLGFTPKDRDYVVVGATSADVANMLAEGYQQVGADFPVFLHPETKDEYALARVERKTGTGYLGFTTETSGVSLEDDLARRDLTINAMAMDSDGRIYDFFNGRKDLECGILRHVSPAFREDPLRVLRVARFQARYAFDIAPETLALMRVIVQSGELMALSKERIWKEIEKILVEDYPEAGLRTLVNLGVIARIFGATMEKSYFALEQFRFVETHKLGVAGRFTAFAHYFDLTEAQLRDLRVPTDVRKLYLAFTKVREDLPQYHQIRTIDQLEILRSFGLFSPVKFAGTEMADLVSCLFSPVVSDWLSTDQEKLLSISIHEVIGKEKHGATIGLMIENARIKALQA